MVQFRMPVISGNELKTVLELRGCQDDQYQDYGLLECDAI